MIKKFTDFNSINEDRQWYKDTISDSLKIEITNWDKKKYDSISKNVVDIEWDAEFQHRKSGIEGVSVIVNKVVLSIDFVLHGDDQEETASFTFDPDQIETEILDKAIPLYAEEVEIDLKTMIAKVKFGRT